MDIKKIIKEFVASKSPEAIAVEHGLDLAKVKHWTKLPTFEAVDWYLDNVLMSKTAKTETVESVSDASKMEIFKSPEFEWEGKRLSVLFPVYRDTNPATTWCLVALALDLGKEKVRFDMEFGDGMIYHSRCKLADRFMDSPCEWSLWLDSDMIVPIARAAWYKKIGQLPDDYSNVLAGQHVVNRLLSHGKKLVGGCYYGRNRKGRPMFYEGQASSQIDKQSRNSPGALIKTKWVGTGRMLVHRDVYTDIRAKFPELGPTERAPWWNYFLPMQEAGEDQASRLRS